MTSVILFISLFFLTGYNNFLNLEKSFKINFSLNKKNLKNTMCFWNNFIEASSNKYKVDKKLIKSIIYAESSGNPAAKSSSNAIGLMQIKPSLAGMEAYRFNGKKGHPSLHELFNPKINIDIGTAYLSFLQKKKMLGIKNKDIMKCAIILSYVNGPNAFFKIFSRNKKQAISIINNMKIKSFCEYIKKNIHQNKHFVI